MINFIFKISNLSQSLHHMVGISVKGLRCSEESRFLGKGVSNLMPDLLGRKRVSGEVQVLPVSIKTRRGRMHLPYTQLNYIALLK